MKKLVYSSALIALLLAGCGTDEEQVATPAEQQTEQTATTNEEQKTSASSEESEEAKEENNDTTSSTSNNTTTNTNTNTSTSTEEQSEEVEEEEKVGLTLYSSNEDATLIVPFEVAYEGAEDQLVPFIFEKVDAFDTNLLDYQFENDGATLKLNIDDTIFNVQGSAGSLMYVNTLVQSFFDNFEALEEVVFLYNGAAEPVLDHVSIGQPYKRADITNIAP